MKKYSYMLLGCMMWMFGSCVQDAQLEEVTLASVELEVKVENDGVKLMGQIQNVGKWPVEQYGFYLEREWQMYGNKKTDIENIVLDASGAFETWVDNNLYDGLSCKVYSYAKIGGSLYRSQSESFVAKGAAEMLVESMEQHPDKNQVYGELVIQGKNLTRLSHLVKLELDTTIVGQQSFRLEECTEERLVFRYDCNHIGTFPLRLQIGDQSKRLQEHLEIKGPVLKGIPESIDVGVPVEFVVEDPYGMAGKYWGADILQGNGYVECIQQGNKQYAMFHSDSPSLVVQFFCSTPVYYPPVEIKITNPWEKQYDFTGGLRPQRMWKDYACTVSEEDIALMHVPTGKIERYPQEIVKDYWVDSQYSPKVVIADDVLYACYYIIYSENSEWKYSTLVLSFDLNTRQWNKLGVLPDEEKIGLAQTRSSYRAVAKKGDELYLFYDFLCKVVAWNMKTNACEVHDVSLWEPNDYPLFIGQWKDNVYFWRFDGYIRELELGVWNSDKVVANMDFITSNQVGNYLVDGYYYRDDPMRRSALDGESGLVTIEYLGYPQEAYKRICTILPCESGVWCYDRKGSVYCFKGEFSPVKY